MHAAVCDFILDCLQNSVEADASLVKLMIEETSELFSVEIADNGIGMTDEELREAVDPFYTDGLKHEKRKVGLGLPFLVQAIEQTDGLWSLESEKGKGTELNFSFRLDNVDTPPIGDINGMLLQAMMFDGDFELEFVRKYEKDRACYTLKRSELIEVLGDFNDAQSLILARQFLKSQEEDYLLEKEDCLLEKEDLIEGDR